MKYILVLLLCNFCVFAQQKPLKEEEFLYKSVPDITLNTGVQQIKLSDLWKSKPLLLTFVYSECNGVCVPYLKSFNQAINKVGGSGKDYNTVILSFDTTDNRNKMTAMAAMAGLSRKANYILATTNSNDLKKILSAAGFWVERIGSSNQFDHPTEILAIKEGKIIRVMQGNEVSVPRLYEVLEEILGYFVRSYPLMGYNVLFTCFKVDPASGQAQLSWGSIFLVLPGILAMVATGFIFRKNRLKNS